MKKLNPAIFKKHLKPSNLYVGGKTRDEVASIVGDKKIYKLSSNENLLGSSPMAIAAIKENIDLLHEYPDRSDKRLRDQLAIFYKNRLSADHFISAPSGSETLDIIIRAFLNEGDEYIISNPCFKPYEMFSDKLGAIKVDVPLLDPNYTLDVDGILDAVNDKTRIIFLTSPNNPTATYVTKDEVQKILDHIPDHVIVIYDEVYKHYVDAEDYVPAEYFVNQGYPIIGLNSFSKTYGLAGMRVGYAYSTLEITGYLRRMYKPFMLNTLTLEASIAALKDTDFLQATKDLIQSERPKFYKTFEELKIKYYPSQGNFVLFNPNHDTKEIEEKLLAEGIMVRPVAGFGAPNCIRVTVGTPDANQAFFIALAKVMEYV